jgi:hypothetical protein
LQNGDNVALHYRLIFGRRRFWHPSAPLALCVIASLAASPAHAEAESVEPTSENCVAAVEQARALATALPADDLSRYFAERHLLQAMAEAGNNEFDECLEYAERATIEVKERRHVLQPGETFKVLQPHE